MCSCVLVFSLHAAAAWGQTECLVAILSHGADPSITDATGLSPLHLAAKNNHVECCKKLIQSKCPIDAVDSSGKTAVHHGAASGSLQAVQLLCEQNSPINIRDADGLTPLLLSARHGHAEVCSVLLDCGAEINASDNGGRTAVMLACESSSAAVVDTLVQHGADLSVVDSQGHDVGHYAKLSSSSELQTALAKYQHWSCNAFLLFQSYNNNELQNSSRPNSLTSNSSFHSTQDELEGSPSHPDRQTEVEDGQREEGRSKEEIQLLRQALESVQVKLLETRKENRSLQAQLRPERLREEDEGVREKEREAELMESLAELQAKLTDTQERYHQALEEVEELRLLIGPGDTDEKQEVQRRAPMHEHEVKQLRAQLLQSENQKEKCLLQIKHLEEAMRRAEDKHNGKEQRSMQIEELYKEAVEEIRVLQEALRGTVPVEAAAKDFEEMKGELNEVISGLQRRLLELSHSYSETKSQLSAAQKQLSDNSSSSSSASEQQQGETEVLQSRVEKLQACLQETERKYCVAQQEITQLRQEAERQMDSSVSLTDHTQVVASLGNAIKDLEKQLDTLKEQLHQKTLQLDALQRENPGLTMTTLYPSQIDDLSREVCKLKDALNSLSQLSYNSSSPSKRQQQNQHIETMQQQIKQLQYQLTESKKQHHEIVSVYRMHLLYAVQGQMDEDVQKALKQILMMCKMPSQAKEAC
uniref:Uncharacterized protein n=1 Tax=Periophthalmus magnuspinnatus TaxID=409849 RepID=A0A3B4BLX8_9GOBI